MGEAVSLKPCPLCGGKAEIWRAQDNGYTKPLKAWVACMDRCCAFITQEHMTNEEAIAAWNTRFPTNKDETIAKLREALALIIERDQVPKHHVYRIRPSDKTVDGQFATIARAALTSTKKEG